MMTLYHMTKQSRLHLGIEIVSQWYLISNGLCGTSK